MCAWLIKCTGARMGESGSRVLACASEHICTAFLFINFITTARKMNENSKYATTRAHIHTSIHVASSFARASTINSLLPSLFSSSIPIFYLFVSIITRTEFFPLDNEGSGLRFLFSILFSQLGPTTERACALPRSDGMKNGHLFHGRVNRMNETNVSALFHFSSREIFKRKSNESNGSAQFTRNH